MTFKSLATITAITLSIPAAASAQDNAQWNGFYLGAGVMAATESLELAPGATFEFTGTPLTVFGGYNYAVGSNFVVGAEVAVALGDISTQQVFAAFQTQRNLVAARMRGGYATGDALIYAGAGFASAEMVFPFAPVLPVDASTGAQLFLGVDYALSDQIFARLEFQSTTLDLDDTFVGPLAETVVSGVTVGLGFRF